MPHGNRQKRQTVAITDDLLRPVRSDMDEWSAVELFGTRRSAALGIGRNDRRGCPRFQEYPGSDQFVSKAC